MILKSLHIALAYLTVGGFVLRGMWAITDSPLRTARWVRILPHVIDTLLLTAGVVLAVRIGADLLGGWLGAKLIALLGYIALGVVTMRAQSTPLQIAAFVGALLCVTYIFAVAFTRSAWPPAAI